MFNFLSWFRDFFYEAAVNEEVSSVQESSSTLSASSPQSSSETSSLEALSSELSSSLPPSPTPYEPFSQISSPINMPSLESPQPQQPSSVCQSLPKTPMNINDLPSDCLLAIFSQLSLHDRLQTIRLVCADWFTLVEEMCMRSHSLTLFGCQENITDYVLTLINENTFSSEERRLRRAGASDGGDDDLIIEGANPKVVFTFTMLFSALERLTIHLSSECHFETLRLWLMQLPALKSLTLCGFIEHQDDPARFRERILPTLNELDKLVELHLLVTNFFALEDGRTLSLKLLSRVMSQLTAFSLAHYNGSLYHVLRQLSPERCRRLRLDVARDESCNEVELEQLVAFNRQLFANLTHLRFSLPSTGQTNKLIRGPVFCASEESFPNLVSLDLQSCAVMNFELIKVDATFIEALNRLPVLTELRLSHVGLDLLNYDFETATLAQIKVLHLSQVRLLPANRFLHESGGSQLYTATSTEELLWRSLSFLFPNLKKLFVRVKRSSVEPIKEHVKAFFGTRLERAKIYSVEDELKRFYGRHSVPKEDDESNDEVEKMQFFSQYFFDKIKRL